MAGSFDYNRNDEWSFYVNSLVGIIKKQTKNYKMFLF